MQNKNKLYVRKMCSKPLNWHHVHYKKDYKSGEGKSRRRRNSVNFEFSTNYFLGNMHGKCFKSLSYRGPRMFVVLIW